MFVTPPEWYLAALMLAASWAAVWFIARHVRPGHCEGCPEHGTGPGARARQALAGALDDDEVLTDGPSLAELDACGPENGEQCPFCLRFYYAPGYGCIRCGRGLPGDDDQEDDDDDDAPVPGTGVRGEAAEAGPGLPAPLVPGAQGEAAGADQGVGQRGRGDGPGLPGGEGGGGPVDDAAGEEGLSGDEPADHGARDGVLGRLDAGVERGAVHHGDLPDRAEDPQRAAAREGLAADGDRGRGLDGSADDDLTAEPGDDWADTLHEISAEHLVPTNEPPASPEPESDPAGARGDRVPDAEGSPLPAVDAGVKHGSASPGLGSSPETIELSHAPSGAGEPGSTSVAEPSVRCGSDGVALREDPAPEGPDSPGPGEPPPTGFGARGHDPGPGDEGRAVDSARPSPDPLAVACPYCAAVAGTPCGTESGKVCKRHKARVDAMSGTPRPGSPATMTVTVTGPGAKDALDRLIEEHAHLPPERDGSRCDKTAPFGYDDQGNPKAPYGLNRKGLPRQVKPGNSDEGKGRAARQVPLAQRQERAGERVGADAASHGRPARGRAGVRDPVPPVRGQAPAQPVQRAAAHAEARPVVDPQVRAANKTNSPAGQPGRHARQPSPASLRRLLRSLASLARRLIRRRRKPRVLADAALDELLARAEELFGTVAGG